jgi:hypothetical protein
LNGEIDRPSKASPRSMMMSPLRAVRGAPGNSMSLFTVAP